jgi:hypothetical protein
VGLVGAREGVDHVDVLVLEVLDHLLAQPVEVLLRDRLVDRSPPDPVFGSRFLYDELVLGRTSRVAAGVDAERAPLGQPALIPLQSVRVEERGRRLVVDATFGIQATEAGGAFGRDCDGSPPRIRTNPSCPR